MTILDARQKQRYDTAANWTSANPLLLAGELGIESDTNKVKVGNGSSLWNSLEYLTTNVPSIDSIGDVTISGTVAEGSALVYINNAWRKGPVIGYEDPNQDQYFDNVTLLLKFNGSNNSTIFTDSSIYAHQMSRLNNPIISTDQSKYDGSSGRFSYFNYTGVNNNIYNSANMSTLSLGTSNYTIEAWVYIDEDPSATTSKSYYIMQYSQNYPGVQGFIFAPRLYTERFSSNLWRFIFYYVFDINSADSVTSSYAFAARQWHHVAVTRNGTTLSLYVNGQRQATSTNARHAWQYTSTGSLIIGARTLTSGYSVNNNNFSGYIDDFRITKGTARYTGVTYTVPFSAAISSVTAPRIIYPLNYHDDVSDIVATDKQTLSWNASAGQFEPRDIIAKQINNTTPPATATSSGTAGEVRYDSSYIYLCTATNTWIRAALNTW